MRPRIDRPRVPEGYGVEELGPYLTWVEVEARLVESRQYWLATTRPDGRPHVVPRWGVWLDGKFWYDGSPETRHARNLESNPHCVLHLEDGWKATIVEGQSRRSEPIMGPLGERLAAEFAHKYRDQGYAPEPTAWSDEMAGGMRVLSPEKVLAWSSFPSDLTRFRFTS